MTLITIYHLFKMATYCRHGDGIVIATEDGRILYVMRRKIVASDRWMDATTRHALETKLSQHPPRLGDLTSQQIAMALRIPYDEDEDSEDCSLGSEDTWSSEDSAELSVDEDEDT